MSESCAARLPKPQLRGLLNTQIRNILIQGIVAGIASGIAFKIFVCDPRKKRYADYYKNYDAEKEFQKMKKLGVFQSG